MKTSSLTLLLFLCIGLLSWSSCGDDDALVVDTLNYDGPNFTAPFNDAGQHTFAAFFPESEIQPYVGRQLNKVSFFLQNIPTSTSVVIFAAGPSDQVPGAELYRIDLTGRIRSSGWIEHNLTTPIDLTGAAIWIGVEADLPSNQFQAVGCDEGLNYNPNGDRYQIPTGFTWTDFETFTGGEATINWNIRGFISAE